ncbi:hypothetical protein CALCODRAFT_513676, partial [Calocera cornea HHB12733]
HEPFTVTLKYGQDTPVPEDYDEWEKMKTSWDTQYDVEKIGRFVCAVAVNQSVYDGSKECAAVCNYDVMKKQFGTRQGGGDGASFYPLAFTTTACNIQANGLPAMFQEELEQINNAARRHTKDKEGNITQGKDPFECIKWQAYSAQKTVFRNSKAEHDISLGREGAVLAMCGIGGQTVINKVTEELRDLRTSSSFKKTQSRIENYAGGTGVRSEMELVIHPHHLPKKNRTGAYFVSTLLKRMTSVYWQTKGEQFQAALIVLRPG